MLSLAAYCMRNFSEADEELTKVSSLITSSTENYMEFEIQRLQALACLLREEGKYSQNYEVAYGGLQQMESISPGWYTAQMLYKTGCLFSVLANEERNEEVRQSLKHQACTLFAKAIPHASHSLLKSSLQRRCHLRLAMVYLDYSALVDKASDSCVVSSDNVEAAIKHTLVVEESSLKEEPLTNYNKCYLYPVKSDLNYRKSQIYQGHRERFLKKAREYVDQASRANFLAILKYSESRLQRVLLP